jgi:uncharacterized membrane protein
MAHDPDMGRRGRWLGMPYDWRRPTMRRAKDKFWNPGERRIFVPKSFGWGYGVNLHALWRRLGGGSRRT